MVSLPLGFGARIFCTWFTWSKLESGEILLAFAPMEELHDNELASRVGVDLLRDQTAQAAVIGKTKVRRAERRRRAKKRRRAKERRRAKKAAARKEWREKRRSGERAYKKQQGSVRERTMGANELRRSFALARRNRAASVYIALAPRETLLLRSLAPPPSPPL
jgi:hypothetical protein